MHLRAESGEPMNRYYIFYKFMARTTGGYVCLNKNIIQKQYIYV